MSRNNLETRTRRKQLMEQMGPNSIALVAAAPVRVRTGDAEYPYRQNSDFHYLTGFAERDALLALLPGRAEGETVLFCQARDELRELWEGKRMGPDAAPGELGVDEAHAIDQLDSVLPGLIGGRDRLYYAMGRDAAFDTRVMDWLRATGDKSSSDARAPGECLLLDRLLHELRLTKSQAEITLMEKAAQISVEGHRRAMACCKPGMKEYELEAELLHAFTRNGSRAPAYHSIVGAGANACTLHYFANDAEILDGDLVLIDAGCEFEHYASDVTCTFPANGRFSPQQKAIYEIVLKAQQCAIEAVKPGATWDEPHNASLREITRGLVELGLLHGDPATLIESEAFKDFYMHRVGHWVGMDVHDVGGYMVHGSWRRFGEGMVTTIEPGIYIAPNNTRVPPEWRGIGVRIEDEVLVTATGQRVLSTGVPRTVPEIEAFMANPVP